MKGWDVVILSALKPLQTAGLPRDMNITIVFTGDEEHPGEPLADARRALVEAAQHSDVALAFEAGNRSDATSRAAAPARGVSSRPAARRIRRVCSATPRAMTSIHAENRSQLMLSATPFPWAKARARPLRAPFKGARLRRAGPSGHGKRTRRALFITLIALVAPLTAQDTARTILRAGTVLDGRGGVQHNVDIVVVGSRIERIAPRGPLPAGARIVDLGDRTVLPGLIDAHTHPAWYFNRKNRLHTTDDGDTPAQSILAAAANAYATLRAGFTTIQSVGSRSDVDLRDWIATQGLPGPRILTSLDPLIDRSLSPDSLRALVRQHKAQGADLIKIFASGSIREGGQQ